MRIRALSPWLQSSSLLLALACPAIAQETQTPNDRDAAGEQAPANTPDGPSTAPLAAELVPPKPLDTPLAYPEDATGAATVLLELTIDAEGHVRDALVVLGPPRFADLASAAALEWRFTPAELRGRRVPAKIRFTVRFTPPESEPESAPVPEGASEPASPARPARRVAAQTPPSNQDAELEFVVQGERRAPGSVTITRVEARAMPGTFGDPLRSIEAQPGVVPIVSGLPAFFIRGAPPANVGFFIDGVDLPLLYHAFLGPSVVHPALIGGFEFYPGASPVEYGRFAGPVVAVRTSPMEGRFSGEGALRAIDVGGFVEVPFRGCQSAPGACGSSGARLAGRYSYTGLILSLLGKAKLDYWDYLGEVKHALGPNDSVGVLAFGAFDYFRAPQEEAANSGAEVSFHRIDARWDHRFGPRTKVRTAITLGYDRAAGADSGSSVVTDHSVRGRVAFSHDISDRASLAAGADVRVDHFGLNANPRYFDNRDYLILFPERDDVVAGAYLSGEFVPTRGIRVAPGVRADVYHSQGTTKVGVDPRVAADFYVSPNVRLEHSIGIAHQRPNYAAQVPGAQVADLEGGLQWALLWSSGVQWSLPSDVSASAAVFRTAYFRALDPIGGARDFTLDASVLERRSTIAAVGLELKLSRKFTRKLSGFLSYTLSRTDQSQGNVESPSGFDRPHVLQGVLGYDFGKGIRAGVRAVYYSGIPELRLGIPSRFSDQRRGTPYFRTDVRLEKRWSLGDRAYWGLVGEVLNATSTSEVVRLDCGELCRERLAGPVILPSVGLEAGF